MSGGDAVVPVVCRRNGFFAGLNVSDAGSAVHMLCIHAMCRNYGTYMAERGGLRGPFSFVWMAYQYVTHSDVTPFTGTAV